MNDDAPYSADPALFDDDARTTPTPEAVVRLVRLHARLRAVERGAALRNAFKSTWPRFEAEFTEAKYQRINELFA